MRNEIHWPTAFALRIFRVPVGLACLWWLMSRNVLEFEVTPKGAADLRLRGRTPRILLVMVVLIAAVVLYAAAGLAGLVPWRTTPGFHGRVRCLAGARRRGPGARARAGSGPPNSPPPAATPTGWRCPRR